MSSPAAPKGSSNRILEDLVQPASLPCWSQDEHPDVVVTVRAARNSRVIPYLYAGSSRLAEAGLAFGGVSGEYSPFAGGRGWANSLSILINHAWLLHRTRREVSVRFPVLGAQFQRSKGCGNCLTNNTNYDFELRLPYFPLTKISDSLTGSGDQETRSCSFFLISERRSGQCLTRLLFTYKG